MLQTPWDFAWAPPAIIFKGAIVIIKKTELIKFFVKAPISKRLPLNRIKSNAYSMQYA
jgi:hypothetical protein